MKSRRFAPLYLLQRKGFTLVELLIVLVIIGTLSVVAYVGITRSQEKNMNAKVLADLVAIQSALDQYKQDNNDNYPVPDASEANVLCFAQNTAYTHDCGEAFFIQSYVTEKVLSARYLPNLPTDPRTGAPYAYGVSVDGQSVQVAGTYWDKENEQWIAKVEGRLADEFPLRSLIRSYNGPDFVMNNQVYLPYNPERFELTAQLRQVSTGVLVLNEKGAKVDPSETLREGYTVQVPKGARATLYFSDGSVSVLGSDTSATELTLLPASGQENSDAGAVTKVFLKLTEGRVFSKVVRLTQASEFNIQTTSAIAGVRGTEFGVEAKGGLGGSDRVYVYSGEVSVRQKTDEEKGQDFVELAKTALDQAGWMVSSEAKLIAVDVVNAGLDLNVPSFEEVAPLMFDAESLTKEYFSQVTLNNNIRPVLLGMNAPESTFTLETLDELNEGQAALLQPTEIFACEASVADECEAAGGEVCNLVSCVQFGLPQPQEGVYTVANDPNFADLYQNSPTRFAFANSQGTELKLSGFSVPAVFIDQNTQLSEEEIELYETEVIVMEGETDIQDSAEVKCELSGGYWYQGSCWVLGAADQSCTDACQQFGEANDLPGLACDTGQWNDTQECMVCKGLFGGEGENMSCGQSILNYAPFFSKNGMACKYKSNEGQDCSSSGLANRICKCI